MLLGRGELDRAEQTADALDRHHAWCQVTVERFAHTVRYTTGQWLEHLLTHPDHGRLDPGRRNQLSVQLPAALDDLGGQLDVEYEAVLTLATRSG